MAKNPVNVGGVTLDTKVLDKITVEMRPKASRIVAKYGFAMTGEAAKNAPVGTEESTGIKGYVGGALRNSITSESQMTDDLTFTLSDGVEYGLRIELGFVGTDSLGRTYNQAAQPFAVPAVETWRDKFLAAFEDLFK